MLDNFREFLEVLQQVKSTISVTKVGIFKPFLTPIEALLMALPEALLDLDGFHEFSKPSRSNGFPVKPTIQPIWTLDTLVLRI